MGATIRVNNTIGLKGDISGITKFKAKSTSNESLQEWVVKNPDKDISEYHRNFIFIHITDKNVNDISHITDPLIIDGNPISNKYIFSVPESESSDFIDLFTEGEATREWSQVQHYLIEQT